MEKRKVSVEWIQRGASRLYAMERHLGEDTRTLIMTPTKKWMSEIITCYPQVRAAVGTPESRAQLHASGRPVVATVTEVVKHKVLQHYNRLVVVFGEHNINPGTDFARYLSKELRGRPDFELVIIAEPVTDLARLWTYARLANVWHESWWSLRERAYVSRDIGGMRIFDYKAPTREGCHIAGRLLERLGAP